MAWNWQLSDWPEFRFDAGRLRATEAQFLKGSGVVVGSLHHLDAEERDGLAGWKGSRRRMDLRTMASTARNGRLRAKAIPGATNRGQNDPRLDVQHRRCCS